MDPFTRFSLRWDAPDLATKCADAFNGELVDQALPVLERAFTQVFLQAGPLVTQITPEQAAHFGEPSEPFPEGWPLYLGVSVGADSTPAFVVQSISPVPDADPKQLRRDIEKVVFEALEKRTGPHGWLYLVKDANA